jgi:penicillin amidase
MIRLLLPGFLNIAWVIFLNTDIPVGENFLPAAGRFFSPFQGVWHSVIASVNSYTLRGPTKENVKILFDERDIPHIYAQSTEDALYAQGYLHASNRLFAMDITQRAASGRLSEILGKRTLAYDQKQRERGFEWASIEKAKGWENYPENHELMQAYINGVNAYIHSLHYADWPLEYKILSHRPEVWTVTNSALIFTSMAINLCLNESDVEFTKAREKLSKEDFDRLFGGHNSLDQPVIPSERKWEFTAIKFLGKPDEKIPPVDQDKKTDDQKKDLNGSNNWAVSGQKTTSGFPILANDPHLGLTLPNIWYEIEIHTPEMSVHGVSLPGLPFVVIGFNERIAWGSTNSGQDVLDWYTITWQDSTRQSYLLDGSYEKAILRPEEIKVRGGKTVTDTIRYTHWGPVSMSGEHKNMSMKWIGHQRADANDIAYLQKINKAKNVNEYRDAVAAFQYPAQNKVFASVDGDIALSVAGVIPIRREGLGQFVIDGAKSQDDWQGFIPFDQAPYIINPVRGFVSSANQSPADTLYPYPLLGTRYFEDYRGRAINMILDSSSNITVSDMEHLQQNNFDLHASEILPVMLQSLRNNNCLSQDESPIADQLSAWNYQEDKDSLSPIYFDLWYEAFKKLTFDELDSMGVMYPEDWRFTEMVKKGDDTLFDIISTSKKERLNDIACISFTTMVRNYNALDNDKKKNWGHYKASEIPHLARFSSFGSGFISTSGGKHIINAMTKSHGPSWRMVVELSNPPKAYVNYPGGQSGNPASSHYMDFVKSFFEGKYYEVSIQKDPSAWKATREININPL